MRRFGLLLGAALVGAALLTVARPAHATFPGANGKIAFASDRDGDYEIYTINPNGTGLSQLTNNAAFDGRPAWSADGTKIVFQSDRDTGSNFQLYVMNANGANPTRLTNDTADDARPSWSPDGEQIAFESDRDGNSEIYRMNADGTGQTRLTNSPGADESFPRYSPDGKTILFTHAVDDTYSLWTMHSKDAKKPTQLTDDSLQAGVGDWSPDGHEIVFSGNYCAACPPSDVFVMDATGKHVRQLTSDFGNNLYPKFSPDGRYIVLTHEDQPIDFTDEQIYTMNADGTAPFNVTNSSSDNYADDWGVR